MRRTCGTFLSKGMKLLLLPITLVVLAACNPYMAAVTAVRETYSIATDQRSVATQAADTAIEAEIKDAHVPKWFADQAYLLRAAIDLVRERLGKPNAKAIPGFRGR